MSDPYVYMALDAQGKKRDWFCEDVLTGRAAIKGVFEDDSIVQFTPWWKRDA